MAKCDMSK